MLDGVLDRAKRGAKDQENSTRDFAAMAGTRGWELFRAETERILLELLEPVAFSPETPLDVRGAVNEARLCAIQTLKKLLAMVENAEASEGLRRKQEAEKS